MNTKCEWPVFYTNKVNRHKSWLEPTQDAKDHVTNCDQQKYIANYKRQIAMGKMKRLNRLHPKEGVTFKKAINDR